MCCFAMPSAWPVCAASSTCWKSRRPWHAWPCCRPSVDGQADAQTLADAAKRLAALANAHRGSNSIDGSAHAAVSATYAAANALAGRALEAASYAAYAAVYAYGGYAVSDPAAFEEEHAWQARTLEALSGEVERQASRQEAAVSTSRVPPGVAQK